MKQQITNKEKGLLKFIEDKQRIITVIGVFTAIITYLFKFLLESNNSLIKENLGWGIMLSYGLLLIMSFLLFMEASKKKYSALSVFFCITLLFIVGSFYSYINSAFQKPLNDFTQIILFYLPMFLVFYVMSKMKEIKLFWSTLSFGALVIIFLFRISDSFQKNYEGIIFANNLLTGIFIAVFLFLFLMSLQFISKIIPLSKKGLFSLGKIIEKPLEKRLNWKFSLLFFLFAILLGIIISLNHNGCLVYNQFCYIEKLNFPSFGWDQIDHLLGVFVYFLIFLLPLYSLLIYLASKRWILDESYPYIMSFILIVMSAFPIVAELVYEKSKSFSDWHILIFDFIGLICGWIFLYLSRNKFWISR